MKNPELEQRVAALEALMKEPCAKCQPEPQPEPVDDDLAEALITKLKDEAAKNGGQGAYAWVARELCGKAATALAALKSRPKPSGEVLAWLYNGPDGEHYINEHRGKGISWLIKNGWTEVPLYAAPPPAKQRLLTVDEYRQAMHTACAGDDYYSVGMVKAINAILQGDG